MVNKEVRRAARIANVPIWKVAYALGISEPTIFRWLRTELPEEKKSAILEAIDKLSKEENE